MFIRYHVITWIKFLNTKSIGINTRLIIAYFSVNVVSNDSLVTCSPRENIAVTLREMSWISIFARRTMEVSLFNVTWTPLTHPSDIYARLPHTPAAPSIFLLPIPAPSVLTLHEKVLRQHDLFKTRLGLVQHVLEYVCRYNHRNVCMDMNASTCHPLSVSWNILTKNTQYQRIQNRANK